MEEPLSELLPAGALAAQDLGASPGRLLPAAAALLAEAAPRLHGYLDRLLGEFREATGLDPAVEFLPYLGHGLASALLPGDAGEGCWPFPRPVSVLRVEDEEGARRFLSSLLQWSAGALAPATSGMVSAMVVTEEHEGVELRGLQVEGLFPIPLPSPTFALVDGLLVVSPFRSAAREAVSSIRGRAPRLGETVGSREGAGPRLAGAVQRWQVDWRAWEGEREKVERLLPGAEWPEVGEGLTATGEGRAATNESRSATGKAGDRFGSALAGGGEADETAGRAGLASLRLAGQVLTRLLASMGRTEGAVQVEPDGHFTATMAMTPGR